MEVQSLMSDLERTIDKLYDAFTSSVDDTTPLTLIHPPTLRPDREAKLQNRYMALGVQHLHLCQLEEKFQNLRKSVFQQQTLCTEAMAPVCALPTEVLSQILRYAAAEKSPSVHQLARVNRTWRNTALRDPLVWRHLSVPGDRFAQVAGSVVRGPLSYVPFHLEVTERSELDIPNHLVVSLQSRLATAHFTSSETPAILDSLNSNLEGSSEGLSVLETLTIKLPQNCATCLHPEATTRSRVLHLDEIRLPRLRTLEIERCLVKLTGCRELRSLTISKVVDHGDLQRLLKECRNIATLRLTAVRVRNWPPDSTSVSLPALESLEVSETSVKSASYFLSIVSVPNLKHLTMTGIEPVSETAFRDFEAGETTADTRLFELFRLLVSFAPRIKTLNLPSPLCSTKGFLWCLLPRQAGGFVNLEQGVLRLRELEEIRIGDSINDLEDRELHLSMLGPIASMMDTIVARAQMPSQMRLEVFRCIGERLSTATVTAVNEVTMVPCACEQPPPLPVWIGV